MKELSWPERGRLWLRLGIRLVLTLLVLLQFPADFGSVAYAAQKKEIRGTISVAANISQQDM